MKQPFPFDPIQDSLLLRLFDDIFESEGRGDDFRKAIYSHLPAEEGFFFTPRPSKQNVMNLLPGKIRVLHENGKIEEIESLIEALIQGKDLERSGFDIALELAEWMVTGFQEEDLSLRLLHLITNHKLRFTSEHLTKFHGMYMASIQEEEDEFRKRENSDSQSTDGND